MKHFGLSRFSAGLFAVLACSLSAFGAESPGDRYLVRAHVLPGGDPDAPIRFLSFVPSDGTDPVFEEPRKGAWRTRVAERILGNPNSYRRIGLQPFDRPFEVKLDDSGLSEFIRPGTECVEFVEGASRRKTFATNAFEVLSAPSANGVFSVRWRNPVGPFRLRCGQGAGTGLLLVSREDLKSRWDDMADAGRFDDIRGEMEKVSGIRGNRWGTWLEKIVRDRPGLWPRIEFVNDSKSKVRVTCKRCNPSSFDVLPHGTNVVSVTGPAPGPLAWTYHEEGLEDDDFRSPRAFEWSLTDSRKTIPVHVPATGKKPDPRLLVGPDVLPSQPGIARWLFGSSADRPPWKAEVLYEGESSPQSFPCDILEPGPNGGFLVPVKPRKPIKSVRLVCAEAFDDDSTFPSLVGRSFGCDDTAQAPGTTSLRKWPRVTIENPNDFPILFSGFGTDELSGVSRSFSQSISKDDKIPLDGLVPGIDDWDMLEAEIHWTASSEKAVNTANGSFRIRRNGTAPGEPVCQPRLEPKPVEWVDDKRRIAMMQGQWHMLAGSERYRNQFQTVLDSPSEYRADCRKFIKDGDQFKTILGHLQDHDHCKENVCRSFRERKQTIAARHGSDIRTIAEKWEGKSVDADEIAVLLALFDEFNEDKGKPDRADLLKRLIDRLKR